MVFIPAVSTPWGEDIVYKGQSRDSWFSNKVLLAHRILLKCEREAQRFDNSEGFYEMAVNNICRAA